MVIIAEKAFSHRSKFIFNYFLKLLFKALALTAANNFGVGLGKHPGTMKRFKRIDKCARLRRSIRRTIPCYYRNDNVQERTILRYAVVESYSTVISQSESRSDERSVPGIKEAM